MTGPRLDPPPGPLARFLLWIAWGLLPLPPEFEPLRADSVRRLLVVRTDDRVGNALLTIPLVRALQKALPHAQVDLLLAARRAVVAEGLPALRIVRFEKTDAWRRPLRFWRWLRSLRAQYDVVIDAAHWHAFSATSALLSRWAASRRVIGVNRGSDRLYTDMVFVPEPGTPEVEAKMQLAIPLGLRLEAPPMETALGRGPAPFDLPPRFIAVNPGARKEDHRWNGFRTLVTKLPLPPVVVWGPGEEQLAAGVGGILAPPTDLDQLAAVFRRAALVVTNDSGPMHLAVACGAPVVGFFLDDDGLRWASPGPRFRAVVRPTVEAALAAVRDLLDSAAPPPESARSPEAT